MLLDAHLRRAHSPVEPAAPASRPAQTRRQVRLRAVHRLPSADFRDASGMKWGGSNPSWHIVAWLLRWATRNNRC